MVQVNIAEMSTRIFRYDEKDSFWSMCEKRLADAIESVTIRKMLKKQMTVVVNSITEELALF
jgi:hypothetical protein